MEAEVLLIGKQDTLRVSMTDALSCGYDQVNMTASQVRVHKNEGTDGERCRLVGHRYKPAMQDQSARSDQWYVGNLGSARFRPGNIGR